MSFEQTRFLGASIANFSAQLGWNGDATSLSVSLVEDTSTETTKKVWASYSGNNITPLATASDTTTADSFSPPEIGAPVYFKFGDFEFSGILQSWEKKNEINGRYYEVHIVGPTEILNNVQLIIGGYSGWVYGAPNLMNIYGYYEYIYGFGGSRINEAGMPWYGSTGLGIKTGINTLCNAGGDGNFSCRMKFKNQYYQIDVSELPVADPSYRMGGNTINLGEAIGQLCQDAGYDFYPYLSLSIGHSSGSSSYLPIIKFKCVSRKVVPDLTVLSAWIESQTEASAKNHGRELRNEEVFGFLIGGQQERIYTTTLDGTGASATIWPYWGVDANGNAIIGTGINDAHSFTIDSRHINCPGVGATYQCSVGELRAAAAGIDSWMTYIGIVFPSKASTLGIEGRINLDSATSEALTSGKGNAATIANTKVGLSEFAKDPDKQEQIFNLFNAIEILAKEYYGRKFMVRLNLLPLLEPFATAIEPDTNRELINYEPIDAGYLDVGAWAGGQKPLNFPEAFEDFMTTDDGKWITFVKFNSANQLECKNLSPDDFLVYNESGNLKLYVKAQIDQKLVYVTASNKYDPRAVITLPSSVNMRVDGSNEVWGPSQIILKAIIKAAGGNPQIDNGTGGQKTKAKAIANENGTNATAYFSIDYAPAAVLPAEACVPLRDNNRTYGPWYGTAGAAAAAGGKVRVEQNQELVPWNYNGYTWMNYAGLAQMAGVTANQQEAEMGRVELVGAPIVNLGDELVAGGPNVTSLDVSIGPNGVSTSYTLRTYTASIAGFAKARADRYQRLSKVARESYRNNLQNARSVNAVPAGYFSARADVFSKKGTAGSVQKSPHLVVYGAHYSHPSFEGSSHNAVTVSFGTMEEGMASLNSTNYTKQAICGLDSLFSPFSYYTSAQLPHYETPLYQGGIGEDKCKSSKYFDPFSHSLHGGSQSSYADGQLYAYGTTIPSDGLQTIKNQISSLSQDIRAIGLKGPITITGWGYDFYGCPVPNAESSIPTLPTLPNRTDFADDFLQKPDKWKTGPLNIRWNPIIKMWDSPYILMKGTYDGVEGGKHMFKYQDIKFPLHDFYNLDDIPVGTKMVCGFMDDELTVISAEC